MIMLADEFPELGHRSAKSFGGSPVGLMIYIQDVDTVFQRALAAGSKQMKPVENQFYGDRSGTLTDPFGHTWTIATHTEDVSPEAIEFENLAAARCGPGDPCACSMKGGIPPDTLEGPNGRVHSPPGIMAVPLRIGE